MAVNYGICNSCKDVVPVSHQEREGKIYLTKHCPSCGTTEALVSSDAAVWKKKRVLCGYSEEESRSCALNCTTCRHYQHPTLVFVDVTNRCNQNCPICIANVPAMGFQFEPPMEYFDKLFTHFGNMKPAPGIELFGGEPTVREDLIDIIKLGQAKGLSMRVVTNGIRLAEEDYCKELLATGVQLMFAFDGRHEDIYRRLRKATRIYPLKLKALENIKRHWRAKITIMTCAAKGINDKYMRDLIEFCHDNRAFIAALDLIPLTETWEPGEVDAVETTIEDVEEMIANALPGVEFVPAGLLPRFKTIINNFNVGKVTFGGAHPNCESVSFLISDGNAFYPVSRYLKVPLAELAEKLLTKDKELGKKLDRHIVSQLFGKRGRQVILLATVVGLIRKYVKVKEIVGNNATIKVMRILLAILFGKKLKEVLRKYTKFQAVLRMIVLPFEEAKALEGARLVDCPAAFGYEDPETGKVRTIPVCAWCMFKNDIMKRITERYGLAKSAPRIATQAAKVSKESS